MQYNILDYLEKSFSEVPDKFVFIDEFNKITYSELYHYARAIGTTIHTGISGKINQPVVVYVDRNLESLVCFQGVAYSGNFYVPIDIQMPKLRIELILKTLNPIAQIVKKSDLDFANSVAPELRTFIYEDSIKEEENSELLEKVRRKLIDRDPVYATFTSGSTGVPKGVVTCHQSVIDMTDNLVNTFNFSRNHIYGNQNPFYFDASIKDIYCTLSTGGTMHIIPRSAFMFPGKLVEYINLHKIDTILWSAAAIALMANSSAFDPIPPSSLKKVMFSGEVMHNKVLNYWRRSLPETMFVNLYGPTEITSVCTYYIVNRPFTDEEVLPIGIPFKNTEILLLNEENQLAKEGETGEICVRGCCLALGYYNNAEKTTAAFCQNPLNSNFPETIYRTGDLARYNEDGQIMFMSRKDNQVKHMGQRVELGEIEILINSMERIDASICFYDHDKQKIVTIYKGTDSMVDKKYILNELKDRLPKFMFPNILIGLNELPYNLNGKIDRTLLKGQYESGVLN